MSASTAALVLLVAVSATGCSHEPADTRRYQITGVVTGHETSPPRVVVSHEAVKGYMPAMTMAFELGPGAPPLQDGDRIVSTLVVTDSRSWLENVRVRGRDATAAPGPAAQSRAVPGAPLPDFGLVDQNGSAVSARTFAGRVLVITFIYTRCPLPDFCPLMVKHLETLRQRVNKQHRGTKLALLGVTLDPEYDSPTVLRAYGESVLKSDNRFEQWTLATGTAGQIADLARFFGIGYRSESGFITHTLSTAVIDHEGRIVRLFPSNSWRPDELVETVNRALDRVAAN